MPCSLSYQRHSAGKGDRSVVCQDVETSGLRRALRSHLQEEEKQAAEADGTGLSGGSHSGLLLA